MIARIAEEEENQHGVAEVTIVKQIEMMLNEKNVDKNLKRGGKANTPTTVIENSSNNKLTRQIMASKRVNWNKRQRQTGTMVRTYRKGSHACRQKKTHSVMILFRSIVVTARN